ncbi:hypothetical protein [Mycobacterium interjectum]|uniref:hypothetical protein n=1 Tax=Mycobacterium interjectum TaxID=33895 RepID=UPI000837A8D2|nr:hypothetical protein [Mycobacterium interjectum]MCV7092030.1 hypothetical protein [Mycobacterium interjectum]
MKPLLSVVALTAALISVPGGASGSPPLSPSNCYPTTNSGNCYEPGEFCRARDHGATGVAGDGERIQCANNDGWRWEPV